ncbi:uncharacterized protein LOC115940260 isoform X2 [Leptonychotes weddellii]|uniref:Uncharacterized protein LOC115940260 isoform X2 n=1 Tax=Leptonychotes weddellii TaxID=9713 RepID=A0A7F8QKR3_LEPWE|nr:uncharacterized protein LOC115940260 isoform X2 [Leptonychotes weddellii]
MFTVVGFFFVCFCNSQGTYPFPRNEISVWAHSILRHNGTWLPTTAAPAAPDGAVAVLPPPTALLAAKTPCWHHEGPRGQAQVLDYFQNVSFNMGMFFNAQMVIGEYGVFRDGQSAIQTEESQQSSLRTDDEDDSLLYGYQDRGDISVPFLRSRAQTGFESHHDTVNDCRELALL